MAHQEQRDFFIGIKNRFPMFFSAVKVLDIGSLDINGNNHHLFTDIDYTGIDVAEGKNVNIISLCHKYDAPDYSFDVIISNDCFEHDMFWQQSFPNIVRMLRSGGLFLFTCKTTGSGEHGTLRSDGGFSSPLTATFPEWANYYRNITEEDIRSVIDVDRIFAQYEFSINNDAFDIRFWGIKK